MFEYVYDEKRNQGDIVLTEGVIEKDNEKQGNEVVDICGFERKILYFEQDIG